MLIRRVGHGQRFNRRGVKPVDGQNRDLNIPTISVEEAATPTNACDEGDDLMVLVTVDDGDGATTADVELYVNGGFVDSMTDDGGGDWSYAVTDVSPGTKIYQARRVTDLGVILSATWTVEVTAEAPSLDVPTGSTIVAIGATIDFEATGTVDGFDNNTTKVEFLVGGVVVATALTDTAGVWEASWDTTGAEPGGVQIVLARRYFDGGTIDSTETVTVALEETPLGADTWLLYWDARDHGWTNGEVLTAAFTPRIGADQLTPTLSPVVDGDGIGGRTAVNFGDALNATLEGHWLAASFTGEDTPCSMVIRCRRTGNEAGVAAGFGRASATDQFLEVGHSAAGAALVRRDGASEASATQTSTTNLGFVDVTLGFSTNGTTVSIYVNGAATNIVGAALDRTTAALTQFRIATTGRDAGGTDDFAGLIQVVAVTDEVLTAEQHAEVHADLVALDLVPGVGTPIMFLGDSLTAAFSYREPMFEHIQAEEYLIDMQGPLQGGSFVDNQHAGYSTRTISQIEGIAEGNLGTGNPYDAVELVIVMAGSNDCTPGYDGPTAAAAYRDMLETIHTQLTSTVATARIAVTTLPPKDGPNDAFVTDFNARIATEWADFNTDHPGNALIQFDAHAAIGGVWDSGLYLDAAHPNQAGNALIAAAYIAATDSYLASISA